MKLRFTLILGFCATLLSAQPVVDFENFNLAPETFLNGSNGSGGFSIGDIFLPNDYNSEWMTWSGWAISNTTDVRTPGFMNQYSAITGRGFMGSAHYAVTYVAGSSKIILRGEAAGQTVPGMYLTNSTYAYLSMRNGDAFSKKFGGLTGNDPDFFLLTIKGYSQGALSADSVNFYLADFRFADNRQDYILDEWTWVDLSSLGPVDSLSFRLSSSDVGQFGMNTPAYFCMDHFFASDPTSSRNAVLVPDLFKVFPNPAADYLQITHSENEPMECFIFEAGGKLVWQKSLQTGEEQLDIRFLPRGSYIVQIQGKKVRSSKLLVKP